MPRVARIGETSFVATPEAYKQAMAAAGLTVLSGDPSFHELP